MDRIERPFALVLSEIHKARIEMKKSKDTSIGQEVSDMFEEMKEV